MGFPSCLIWGLGFGRVAYEDTATLPRIRSTQLCIVSTHWTSKGGKVNCISQFSIRVPRSSSIYLTIIAMQKEGRIRRKKFGPRSPFALPRRGSLNPRVTQFYFGAKPTLLPPGRLEVQYRLLIMQIFRKGKS